MRLRALLIPLVAIVLLLGACDGDEEPRSAGPTPTPTPAESPSPTPSESPSPEVITGSDCPNEAAAVAAGDSNSAASWAGTDGLEVDTTVVVDREAPFGCQAFLVTTVDGVTSSTAIVGDVEVDLNPPRVRTFANLDGEGLPEVFVTVQAGASTEFGALFLLDPVRPVSFEDPTRPNGDLIAFGGTVTHLDGAACVPDEPGTIVVSTAGTQARKYELERVFYDLEDDRLVGVSAEGSIVRFRDLGDYPEFSGDPFSNCPA